MNPEQEIAELKAQLAEAQQCQIKFGQKRNICFYIPGRRFPISLYANEWELIIRNIDRVQQFIEDNRNELDWK